jgi:hypothetical protein
LVEGSHRLAITTGTIVARHAKGVKPKPIMLDTFALVIDSAQASGLDHWEADSMAGSYWARSRPARNGPMAKNQSVAHSQERV